MKKIILICISFSVTFWGRWIIEGKKLDHDEGRGNGINHRRILPCRFSASLVTSIFFICFLEFLLSYQSQFVDVIIWLLRIVKIVLFVLFCWSFRDLFILLQKAFAYLFQTKLSIVMFLSILFNRNELFFDFRSWS